MTYIKMIKHAGTQTIETARLILRRFEVDDADVMFHNWASDNTVTRYMTWQAHKDTDETKGILQQWIDGYSNENSYHWGISLADSELIGSIGIFVSEEDYSGSIGYCIGQKWWSKGYTSEALKAVIDYMFTNTDIERIHAYHAV
ncbi:MAG: GNAT family N-acetyltransferase, partial [Oscillospiraceae bacterium]|nr:GNAT family N-acetyltransferase [Oscillospiraceae bacterium]